MNRLTFDPTLFLSVDAVQTALIVMFAVVGTWAVGSIAMLLIIRDRG